jgi:hypothetical protein
MLREWFFRNRFLTRKSWKDYPLSKFEKNDEKIFFNLSLFFSAGMNNTREKHVKTISDVKKMHKRIILHEIEFDFRTKNCQEMALKTNEGFIISIDGASKLRPILNANLKNALFTQSFDAEFILRTVSVYLKWGNITTWNLFI